MGEVLVPTLIELRPLGDHDTRPERRRYAAHRPGAAPDARPIAVLEPLWSVPGGWWATTDAGERLHFPTLARVRAELVYYCLVGRSD